MRDTYSSLVGHQPMLSFLSLAQNEPATKTRFKLLKVSQTCYYRNCVFWCADVMETDGHVFFQNMVQPCGPPPARDDED